MGFYGNLADLQPCKQNLISVREHPEVVQEYLKQKVMAGRIIEVGDLRQAQALGIHCSPFGVIPKKGRAGRWMDLSSPDGHSINDGISRELSSLSYMSVDDVTAEVVQRGKGKLMAKMDIKQAYRNIPVDRVLLGMHWQGRVFVDGCLPFGLRSAPLLFTAVGDLLQWVMERRGVSWLGHYIDDFVMLGDPGAVDCRDHLQIMKAVCEESGMPTQPEKEEGPTTVLSFLGMELDSDQMVIRLPEGKLQLLQSKLQSWRSAKKGPAVHHRRAEPRMQSHQGRQVLFEETDRPVNGGETVEPVCQAQSRSEGRYQMVVPVWKGLEWGNHDVCHKQSKAGGSVDVRCIRIMGMRSLVWQPLVPA